MIQYTFHTVAVSLSHKQPVLQAYSTGSAYHDPFECYWQRPYLDVTTSTTKY